MHAGGTTAAEAQYRGLLEAVPDSVIIVEHGGHIVASNARAVAQFGYEPGELVGLRVTTLIPAGFAERLRVDDLRSGAEALTEDIGDGPELIGRCKDGTEFQLRLMLSPLDTGAGVLVTAAIRPVGIDDIVEVGGDQAQIALNSIGDGVGCMDLEGRITFLNLMAERLTGWTMAEAMGRPMEEVIRIASAKTHELIPDLTNRAVRGDKTVHLPPDSILIRRDGGEIPVEDSTAPIHDDVGTSTGAVIVFRDVTAALARIEEMARSAQHDFLTGLPNRSVLNDRIRQAIVAAPRHTGQTAVLFIDLDGFKLVNDRLGHNVGDRLLQAVATRMLGCVRASDTVSRQGGDEFVVLLTESAPDMGVAMIADRILNATASIREIDGHPIVISVSIGIALFPADGLDADTLIDHADAAMYQAKATGRSTYRFYDADVKALALAR